MPMFINSVTNHPRKSLDQLIETLKVTYGFDLTKIDQNNLFAYANKYEAIKNRIVAESIYNSYHSDPVYAKAVLITEAIKLLIEVAPKRKKQKGIKESQIDEESMKKETKKLADKDYDGDGKIESPKDEYLGSRIAAAKKAGKLKEAEVTKEPAPKKEPPKKLVMQKGIDPNKTVYVQGEHTHDNKTFKKKFASVASAEKWIKREGGKVIVNRLVNEAALLEDENLDQAETLLAAKDLSDRLQKMAEDAAKMAVDDLMPLVDTMKSQFGQEQANGFNEVVKQNLQTVLDTIIKAKDETDNAILSIQGGSTPGTTSDISNAPAEPDKGDEGGEDIDFEKEFVATPSSSGPETEPLGRAKKEIAEGKIPPQFLANIKKMKEKSKKKVKESVQKCMECDTGVYEDAGKGKMKCNECGHMKTSTSGLVSEAWDTEMHTAEKDKGKWDGWTQEELRKELSKVKNQMESYKEKDEKVPHELRTRFSQLTFALRAKHDWGKVDEEIQTPGSQPSTDDYSTTDLENAMKTGKTSDGRPVNRQQAQQVLDTRKNSGTGTVSEAKKRKVNPYAVGMAQAEKETGDTPPLKKSTIVRAHEIAKGIMDKKEESQLAKTNALIEALISKYNKFNSLLEKHKKQFKKQVNEGKQVDVLNIGYGLEGDAIREKMIQIRKSINETKLLKTKIVEQIQARKKSIAEAKEEIIKFDQQLGSKPYGVVGIADNKKVQKFFESQDQRTMWLEFHRDRLSEHRLIDPEMIQKAKSYLNKKVK